jgi:hypothetical protein
VKHGKNDAADAAAICEAITRPSMRFVPIKSAEQKSALMLHRTRDLLIRQRIQPNTCLAPNRNQKTLDPRASFSHMTHSRSRLCSASSFDRWEVVSAPREYPANCDCYSAAITVAATSPTITLASRNVPIATSSILSQSASTSALCCPNSGAGPTAGGASPKRTGQPLMV